MKTQIPSARINQANATGPGKYGGTGVLQRQVNASVRQGAQRQRLGVIQQPAQRVGVAKTVAQRNSWSLFSCFKPAKEKDLELTATAAEKAAQEGVEFFAPRAAGADAPESAEFLNINGMMCWDAVAYCGFKGGVNNEYKAKESGKDNRNVIDATAPIVTNSSAIPRGHIIGFFKESGELAHVMLSLGNQDAAGTKNNCLWSGDSGIWNKRKLPDVHAVTSQFDDDTNRRITMRHQSF